jgi:hypothetical protein
MAVSKTEGSRCWPGVEKIGVEKFLGRYLLELTSQGASHGYSLSEDEAKELSMALLLGTGGEGETYDWQWPADPRFVPTYDRGVAITKQLLADDELLKHVLRSLKVNRKL